MISTIFYSNKKELQTHLALRELCLHVQGDQLLLVGRRGGRGDAGDSDTLVRFSSLPVDLLVTVLTLLLGAAPGVGGGGAERGNRIKTNI